MTRLLRSRSVFETNDRMGLRMTNAAGSRPEIAGMGGGSAFKSALFPSSTWASRGLSPALQPKLDVQLLIDSGGLQLV